MAISDNIYNWTSSESYQMIIINHSLSGSICRNIFGYIIFQWAHRIALLISWTSVDGALPAATYYVLTKWWTVIFSCAKLWKQNSPKSQLRIHILYYSRTALTLSYHRLLLIRSIIHIPYCSRRIISIYLTVYVQTDTNSTFPWHNSSASNHFHYK